MYDNYEMFLVVRKINLIRFLVLQNHSLLIPLVV